MGNIKSGQNVYLNGLEYLFLGYNDNKRKWGTIADRFGNKSEIYVSDLTI